MNGHIISEIESRRKYLDSGFPGISNLAIALFRFESRQSSEVCTDSHSNGFECSLVLAGMKGDGLGSIDSRWMIEFDT